MANKSKKETLLTEAQRLFVEEQESISEIGKILNLSRKTLTRWKTTGDWDVKKDEFIRNKTSLHASLYKLTAVAVDELTRSMENGDWDTQQVFAVKSLVQTLQPSRQYESQEQESHAKKKHLSEDELVDQVWKMLGVR